MQVFSLKRLYTSLLNLLGALSLISLGVGCSTWDEEIVAPEDFRSTYIKLHGCKESPSHQAANYAVTWLSPNGREPWEAYEGGDLESEFGVGTISIKAQYDDSSCSNLSGYTMMEKVSEDSSGELGGWRWQFINNDGTCNDCDSGVNCSGCHSACSTGPSYFCTPPSSM